MMSFDLGLFSKHRAVLMGVATLMIIICHMPIYVKMPGWLVVILGNCGTGCDVFLFLSGMGMYNSYVNSKKQNTNVIKWFWKRYVRIVVPCAFFIVGLYVTSRQFSAQSFFMLLQNLSGFYYLTGHLALWFVACTLLLYALTPLIHKTLTCKRRFLYLSIYCIFSLVFWYVDLGDSTLAQNWQFCISRWPSYFIGYTLAIDIKEHRRGSLVYFVIFPLIAYTCFFILNHTVNTNFSLFWTQGIPIVTVCAILIEKFSNSFVNYVLTSLGIISLESYATNVLVLPHLRMELFELIDSTLMLFYIIATFVCLLMSLVVNWLSKIIIYRIS